MKSSHLINMNSMNNKKFKEKGKISSSRGQINKGNKHSKKTKKKPN